MKDRKVTNDSSVPFLVYRAIQPMNLQAAMPQRIIAIFAFIIGGTILPFLLERISSPTEVLSPNMPTTLSLDPEIHEVRLKHL